MHTIFRGHGGCQMLVFKAMELHLSSGRALNGYFLFGYIYIFFSLSHLRLNFFTQIDLIDITMSKCTEIDFFVCEKKKRSVKEFGVASPVTDM